MGAKGNAYAVGLLKQVFQNVPLELGDALYFSLHTKDPGAGGSQDTNEAQYEGYKRVRVERSEAGWIVAETEQGASVSPAQLVVFPTGTGGGELCQFGAIGTDEAGPGRILYRGQLRPAIRTGEGLRPEIPTTSKFTET